MTQEEMCTSYCIHTTILNSYFESGILSKKKEYDDRDLQRISFVRSLENLGFDLDQTIVYLSLYEDPKRNQKELIRMLTRQRERLLDAVHWREKQIRTLDEWLYDLRHTIQQ